MTNHRSTLEEWSAELTHALTERNGQDALADILVRMTADGWGTEAAEARRHLLPPATPQSLGGLLGHDPEAARQLTIIRDAYRSGGLSVLRAVCGDVSRIASRVAVELLLVEAVLALEERRPGARRAEELARFERAERADEAEREWQGGSR